MKYVLNCGCMNAPTPARLIVTVFTSGADETNVNSVREVHFPHNYSIWDLVDTTTVIFIALATSRVDAITRRMLYKEVERYYRIKTAAAG